MVSLFTPSTVCKRFQTQLLAMSLVVSIHHTSLQFLNILHWLPVNYRINFKICCITHHDLSLHEPYYLSSLFSLRSNSHSFHSSSFSPLGRDQLPLLLPSPDYSSLAAVLNFNLACTLKLKINNCLYFNYQLKPFAII